MKKDVVIMSKIMILSFAEDEEDVYKGILNIIDNMNCFERHSISERTAIIQIGALKMDVAKRIVAINNAEIELTNIEFEILYLLANNQGRVFSKEQIYDIVWQEPYMGDYNIVMSHIHNIREKIEDNPSKPIYIQTVWGVGYRFNKNLQSN